MSQPIFDRLKALRGLPALKQLLYEDLGYPRANQILSTRGWPTALTEKLQTHPLIVAEAGAFKIIYLHLCGALERGPQRGIIDQLLTQYPTSLFIFSDKDQVHWHFVQVKHEGIGNRSLLRRMVVDYGNDHRTVAERLALLDYSALEQDLFGVSALALQAALTKAFDVEAVSKKFFEDYRRLFATVEQAISALDSDSRRLFVQKLFNRLMFLMFVERKGWLHFNGRSDYLRALWEDYLRSTAQGTTTFYADRLQILFFHGLNRMPNAPDMLSDHDRERLIGQVPYLNGGLFEHDDDDTNPLITIPDTVFGRIIHELFYRYNWTVTESTPLDVEVAVDPEMLGRVFEELVTGRHDSGSYYTPKPIVSFMCREGLKGYLQSQVPDESAAAIEAFVDEHTADQLTNPEAILSALQQVRVCDPACGSGAYLLGMLHELLDLRAALFAVKQIDHHKIYDRKLAIIQQNIYGVDIDPFAVNIARLRLWLSLMIEFEGASPPPLPNLDYKIEVGDSLAAPDPKQRGIQQDMRQQLVSDLQRKKAEYISYHGDEKRVKRHEIEELETQIRVMTNGATAGFDWAVDFADVFPQGFDIIVANPPYVRQELISDQKPSLKRVFPTVYKGTADLYTYFYARSVELLRDGGMLAFITPNKWFRAGYGDKLRQYMAENTVITSITDFGELPVFATAATFPMIFIAKRQRAATQTPRFTQVKTLNDPYPDVKRLIKDQGQELDPDAIKGAAWVVSATQSASMLGVMQKIGIRLEEYVEGNLFRGVLSGYNKAFVIDASTRERLIAEDKHSAEIIKPLAVGDDVRRWHIRNAEQWLIFTPWSIDINLYPAILAHLKQWEEPLKQRPECKARRYNWWCMARYGSEFMHFFSHPKIVFPDIAKESRFAFDPKGFFVSNTVYFIPLEDLYLLGILNSYAIWAYAKESMTVLGDAEKGGRLRFFRQFVQNLPIPQAADADRQIISSLVEQCLAAQGQGVESLEVQINERVAWLYGLNEPQR